VARVTSTPSLKDLLLCSHVNRGVQGGRLASCWMISVPEIDGLMPSPRLAEVEKMARDLIAITLMFA
jgi:hypothetical protein